MMSAADKVGFKPLHEAHAIETVVVSVQFQQPLPDEVLRAAFQVADSFHERLSGKQEMRSMGVRIGPEGVSQMQSPSAALPDGLVRFRANPSAVTVEELRVERQSLTYVTQIYGGWQHFWQGASSLINPVLTSIASELGIGTVTSYALTYIDRFVWEGEPSQCKAGLLLNESTAFVSPFVLGSEDLWHSHSGQFLRVSDYVKRLMVVNLACVDEPAQDENYNSIKKRVVRIESSVSDVFNQEGFLRRDAAEYNIQSEINERFASLHEKQRDILQNILNKNMLKKIGM